MKTSIKFTSEMRDQLGLGRKIQTRRPVKPQPQHDDMHQSVDAPHTGFNHWSWWAGSYTQSIYHSTDCPYGAKGTVLPVEDSDLCIEITKIRVERVQDISEDDARREGGPSSHNSIDSVSRSFGYKNWPQSWFAQTWDSIYGETEYKWDQNPWVWVIDFNVREAISLGDALDQVLDEVLSEEN